MSPVWNRCAVLILASLLFCTGAIAQTDEVDPVQLLEDVFAAEKISDSGRLCFNISYDNVGDDVGITPEQRQTKRLEYSWAPGGKFRLVLFGKDSPLRTIVSDGNAIDTGLQTWDARFAFDYNRHGTDGSFDLELQLQNEMWPYSHLLHLHLHPMTGFGYKSTVDQLKLVYRIQTAADLAPADVPADSVTLKLTGRQLTSMQQTLTVRREPIPYVRRSRQDYGAGTDLIIIFERGSPRMIDGVGLVPDSLSLKYREQDAPIASELCADQPNPVVDEAEFRVDYGKSPMIPWPYGSRMKNFWYGIVNTFKDLWEGVSDGEIGN